MTKRDQLDMQVYLTTLTLNATVREMRKRIAVWEPRPMPDDFERET